MHLALTHDQDNCKVRLKPSEDVSVCLLNRKWENTPSLRGTRCVCLRRSTTVCRTPGPSGWTSTRTGTCTTTPPPERSSLTSPSERVSSIPHLGNQNLSVQVNGVRNLPTLKKKKKCDKQYYFLPLNM